MKSKYMFIRPLYIVSFVIYIVIILISCNGCGSKKDLSTAKKTEVEIQKVQNKEPVLRDDSEINNRLSNVAYNKIQVTRNFLGKEVAFEIDPEHSGGEAWTTIWEEEVKDKEFDRKNRICQLSPTVLLYRRFPNEISKNFFYIDQPEKIEFLDTSYKTIKILDIWKERPYQKVENAKLTYWNFDSEGMGVIPYTEQKTPVIANEYSLFTDVRSEGNHVIVNYELRSIKNVKNFGIEGYSNIVVAVRHTLHIYDLQGNLKYKLKDLPSVDGAVVSNDGRYLMFVFVGMGLANANSPFATIERSGWALMRLDDQKVVYLEYTDDGILAFNRLWIDHGYPKISYSTPSEQIDYDYWIYFDEKDELIYTYKLTKKDREFLREQFQKTNRVDIRRQFNEFNFTQIKIDEK